MYDPYVHELQQLPRFHRGPVVPLGDGLFKVNDTTVGGTQRAVKLIPRVLVSACLVRQVLDHYKLIGHAHIIGFKDVFLTDKYLGIVMEYANKGCLISLVRPGPDGVFKPAPERTILFMLQQLVIAVSHFHLNNISNINLSPCNLLFDDVCGIPLLKVNTFRYGNQTPCTISVHRNLGLNLSYLPPEALAKVLDTSMLDSQTSQPASVRNSQTSQIQSPPTTSSPTTSSSRTKSPDHPQTHITDCLSRIDSKALDVWSCGLLLYTMMYGKLPYNIWTRQHSIPDVLAHMQNRQYQIHDSPPYSDGCKALLAQLLDPNPTARISIKGILEDTWFKRGLNESHLTYNASVQRAQRRHYRRYHVMNILRQAVLPRSGARREVDKMLEQEQQVFVARREQGRGATGARNLERPAR